MRLRHLVEGVVNIDWSRITVRGVRVWARYPLTEHREVVLAFLEVHEVLVVWVRDPTGPSCCGLGVLEHDDRDGRPVAYMPSAADFAKAEFLRRCYEEDPAARAALEESTE